jgi:hypothetical protein
VSKSGIGRGEKIGGKEKRKIANDNEIQHICVGTRHNKTH